MADGPWLSDDEQRAWRAWLRAQTLVHAAIGRQLQDDAALSEGDYAVLVHLSESAEGRLRGKALAGALQWEKSRLSHHLTRMEKRGLVARVECPTDGRGAFVVITDEGRARIEAAAPLHVAEVRRSFVDLLGPDRLEALGAACTRLVDALEPSAPCGADAPDDSTCAGDTDTDIELSRSEPPAPSGR
jgi:DNA-binding MarR family transcriptional regulator